MREADLIPEELETLAPVIRLRPVRTLVLSADDGYRDRTTTVLTELGPVAFATVAPTDPEGVAALLEQERADVLVLDATDCEKPAGRVIAHLAEVAPRTGIVVVCHHCTESARDLRALPKWGWTQDLRAGVEIAYREGNPLSRRALTSLRRRSPGQRMAGPLSRR